MGSVKYRLGFICMTMVAVALLLLLLLQADGGRGQVVSLKQFGAVPDVNSLSAAQANSRAIESACRAANNSGTVLVTADEQYYMFMANVTFLYNVTLQVDGVLRIYNNITEWPVEKDLHSVSLTFFECNSIRLTGSGLVDGQGYDWWWYVILSGNGPKKRPKMIWVTRSQNVFIDSLTFINSPSYHLFLTDIKHVRVSGINITVDVTAQKALMDRGRLLNLPIFPLNTDGVDPAGVDVVIENSYIENFDDAVAVKPTDGSGLWGPCSRDMLVRNLTVRYGVGATIGSVPPHPKVNCIRNITFDTITFHSALKAVYVKSNPGNEGYGVIEGITYRNLKVLGSIWYPIWIGPQQQKQPDTVGTGCSFFFPINRTCPTNWRVSITNIAIENAGFFDGDTIPGVVLCDPKTPCTGFRFHNVDNQGSFGIQPDYYCANADINQTGYVTPLAKCTPSK